MGRILIYDPAIQKPVKLSELVAARISSKSARGGKNKSDTLSLCELHAGLLRQFSLPDSLYCP